jgi:hypothetical protein
MTPEAKTIPMTLTIDMGRHTKLKKTSALTRISMSEIVRVALDRLWDEAGDLDNPSPKLMAIFLLHPRGLNYVQATGRVGRHQESDTAAKKKKTRKKAG